MNFHTCHTQTSLVCTTGNTQMGWPAFVAHVHARLSQLSELSEANAPLKGRRWMLVDEDPLAFVVNLLAVLASGGDVVVPPNFQPGTIAQLAFAHDAMAPVGLPSGVAAGKGDAVLPPVPLVGIIDMYTSGSTGEPKRIRKTLGQFQTEIATLEAQWGARVGDATMLATAPHTHFYGLLFRVLWPLVAARKFDTALCTDPQMVASRLAACPHAALVSSPAQLSRMPELVELTAMPIRPLIVFSSGGPLAAATAQAFSEAWGEAPTEVFGSTETGGIAWRKQDGGNTAWTPFPGVRVHADDDTALVVQSGWLDDDQPWRMEDGVQMLEDGRFVMRGRLDRTVKIEEKRVALPDIEAKLLEHAMVASAAAVVLAGNTTGNAPGARQRIAAVVVLQGGNAETLQPAERRDIAAVLRAHLANYFDAVVLPRRWRFVQAMPYNERGKLTAASLSALFAQVDADPEPDQGEATNEPSARVAS